MTAGSSSRACSRSDGRRYSARHIVIATGSDPVIPPIPGLRELDGVWTNREATGVREIPESLVILGGGPVGVEMAQAFATLGTDVHLVEGMDHILPREPRPLGEALGEAISGERLRIHLGRRAASVSRDGGRYVVSFEDGTRLDGERLLVATGRRPRVEGLGLENVGIEASPRGIPVDARMSAGDGVWAIGDVTGIWPLTYMGKYHGRIAAANILGESREADYTRGASGRVHASAGRRRRRSGGTRDCDDLALRRAEDRDLLAGVGSSIRGSSRWSPTGRC